MATKKPKINKYQMKKKDEVLKVEFQKETFGQVIAFPEHRVIHPENLNKNSQYPTLEIDLDIQKNSKVFETLERIIPIILEKLESEGIDLSSTEKENLKDTSFFIEAFKSVLYKHHKMLHPFQLIADAIFILEKNGDLNNVKDKKILLNILKGKK